MINYFESKNEIVNFIEKEFPEYDLNKFTQSQKDFLFPALMGESIFLTGKAGTGKTYIVKVFIDIIETYNFARNVIRKVQETQKIINEEGNEELIHVEVEKNFTVHEPNPASRNSIICAPTGIASQNIGGVTIHSAFKLPIQDMVIRKDCRYLHKEKKRVLQAMDCLIIDEVSMLRPDILDGIEYTMEKNFCGSLEYKQVIFIGDLAQLAPVMRTSMYEDIMDKYEDCTFLSSEIYQKINPTKVDLGEVVRQSDPEFIEALNIIREGKRSPYFKQFQHTEAKGVVLAPTKRFVEIYNERKLAELDGKKIVLKAELEGQVKESDFSLEHIIELKHGCKIMYLANHPPLYNGAIGTYVMKEDGTHWFMNSKGTLYAIEPLELEKTEYVKNEETELLEKKCVAKLTQYPVQLAYAMTIHKSQGLTFDEVTVDLSEKCFAKGQLYVALSRVTSPEGLRIIVNR